MTHSVALPISIALAFAWAMADRVRPPVDPVVLSTCQGNSYTTCAGCIKGDLIETFPACSTNGNRCCQYTMKKYDCWSAVQECADFTVDRIYLGDDLGVCQGNGLCLWEI